MFSDKAPALRRKSSRNSGTVPGSHVSLKSRTESHDKALATDRYPDSCRVLLE
jgi:hypothetical protein